MKLLGTILTPHESAEEALKAFRTFEQGAPDLIPTGIYALDDKIGGFFSGTCGVLGLCQGLGKSSTILRAGMGRAFDAYQAGLNPIINHPQGVISLEDTEDVWGSRILAMFSGVNSLKIRKKDLTEEDLAALSKARDYLASVDTGFHIAYAIGGAQQDIEDAVAALGDKGVRLIWLDYLQKARGGGSEGADRRNYVSGVYTKFQSAGRKIGAATFVASQFSRQADPWREPYAHWLKESGDIENEARTLILGWRDRADDQVLHFKLDKSTFGGEGLRFDYRRDESGTLHPVVREDDF